MERQIIRIDQAKCDGCGRCCTGCPEGAIQLIDGKAHLVSEINCDGLGACIGECPRGAITVERRDAAPYDELATLERILPQGTSTLAAHLAHLHRHGQREFLQQALEYLRARRIPAPDYLERPAPGQCPGSAARMLHHGQARSAAQPREGSAQPSEGLVSQLGQWPIQLHLISPLNPVFRGADLLLAADCTAFALPDFNQAWLPGRRLLVACPKLDHGQELYLEKLKTLLEQGGVRSLTVMIMEVPCCSGLLRLAQMAAEQSHRAVPIQVVVVGLEGEIRQQGWLTQREGLPQTG